MGSETFNDASQFYTDTDSSIFSLQADVSNKVIFSKKQAHGWNKLEN